MRNKIIKKHLNLSEYLFYATYPVALLATLLEAVTYKGFFQKHFHIPVGTLLLMVLILGSLTILVTQQNYYLDLVKKIYYKVHIFLTPLIFFLWIFLTVVESLTYENYVFSKFHVTPSYFIIPTVLSLFFTITMKIQKAMKKTMFNFKQKTTFLTVYIFLFVFFYQNLQIVPYAANELRGPLTNPVATSREKFCQRWGPDFCSYVEFIHGSTPPSATILIPPRADPWGLEGNDHVMRAFLYPRKVIIYDKNVNFRKENINYILISVGFSPVEKRLFPHFIVQNAQILIFNPKDKKTYKVSHDTLDHRNKEYAQAYGLIKLKSK